MGAASSSEEKAPLLEPEDLWAGGPATEERGTESFSNDRGDSLSYRFWLPAAGELRALIAVCHGIHEHSGRYAPFAHAMTEAGVGVYAIDHVGHGRSSGERADCQRFSDIVDDAQTFLNLVHSKHSESTPLFLMGHSMGSLVATYLALRVFRDSPDLLKGVILSGFALIAGPSAAQPLGCRCLYCLTKCHCFMTCMGGCLSRLAPMAPSTPLDVTALTHKQEILDKLAADPLHYRGQLRNRMAHNVFQATLDLRKRLQYITFPFLAMHGSEDSVCLPEGSDRLYSAASSEDKELKMYDGLYHEILLEVSADRVCADVLAWVEARLPEVAGEREAKLRAEAAELEEEEIASEEAAAGAAATGDGEHDAADDAVRSKL
eukprot:PLAT13498.1.p1 GENE.PLAT13498.1~~PLAT13498.1.p1  ORF type:complete len:383 (+),score=128.84 PLAT13498.1:22-1149(+)